SAGVAPDTLLDSAESAGEVERSDVAEGDALTDRRPCTRVRLAVGVSGGVPDRVESGDDRPIRGQCSGASISLDAPAGPEVGEHNLNRVERAALEWAQVRVRADAGVTVITVVGRVA